MSISDTSNEFDGIAIVGMACRFPGAKNVIEFWENLCNGVESITFYSDEELEEEGIDSDLLCNPSYIKARGQLEDADMFDASFFGINNKDAEIMDPQHRLLLECTWEALEDAGYDSERFNGKIGVYAGESMNLYLLLNVLPCLDKKALSFGNLQTAIGNDKDSLTTTISYRLNLKGPAITVQTSSSTSLVAICVACQSLLSYSCDMALAGGVSVGTPKKSGYLYEEGGIVSPDGHCRPFDAKAKGFVPGYGMGVVVLKRLSDAIDDRDSIYAVIKGFAVNNDGSKKVSYSAPSIDGQAEVIVEAQALAGIEPDTISYIEAHGTGTELGDPIEIEALTKAFRISTEMKCLCTIGSVKSNIGHLDTAAGVAGIIKTALALNYKKIPATLHFEQPNPKIDFKNSPFYINTRLLEWKTEKMPRRAGVNSIGMGGTNSHVVLEEDTGIKVSEDSRSWQLLILSAKTNSALEKASNGLCNFLINNIDTNIADVAYTLQVGRREMNHRRIVVCQNRNDAINTLINPELCQNFSKINNSYRNIITFMFTGQGSHYINMASELYQNEQIFYEQINRCSKILKPYMGLNLEEILYPKEGKSEEYIKELDQTWITQPALFVIEYAMANLWMEWGVKPQAMIGHSIGELVAACIAEVFTLEDALKLVAKRAKLMNEINGGSMLIVHLGEKEIRPLLRNNKLNLSAVNSPSFCVVSGITEEVIQFENYLNEECINYRILQKSYAFHSEMMEPVLEPFTELVRNVMLKDPKIPFISNVTGTWITANEATNPEYWSRHIRETVYFSKGIQELLKEPNRIFLEVGPGNTLSTLVKQHGNNASWQLVLSSIRHQHDNQSDVAFILNTLGRLWLAGVCIDWSKFYGNEHRYRIHLPTYPFEPQRYWIEPKEKATNVNNRKVSSHQKVNVKNYDLLNNIDIPSNEVERIVTDIWKELFGIEKISTNDNFFELGGYSLMAIQLTSRLRDIFQVELTVSAFFEDPTITGIVKTIEFYKHTRKENSTIEDILDEIENLSEDEVQNVLSYEVQKDEEKI